MAWTIYMLILVFAGSIAGHELVYNLVRRDPVENTPSDREQRAINLNMARNSNFHRTADHYQKQGHVWRGRAVMEAKGQQDPYTYTLSAMHARAGTKMVKHADQISDMANHYGVRALRQMVGRPPGPDHSAQHKLLFENHMKEIKRANSNLLVADASFRMARQNSQKKLPYVARAVGNHAKATNDLRSGNFDAANQNMISALNNLQLAAAPRRGPKLPLRD